MSWSTISTALQARLADIAGVGKAHGKIRYDAEGFEREQAEELFFHEGSVNVWQVTRTDRSARRNPDDSRITTVQHTVSIRGNLSLVDPGTGLANTEDDFQAIIDAIALDFDQGDRTLGGAAITHSIPQAGQIGPAMFYGGTLLCHDVTLTFVVEENVVQETEDVPFEAFTSPGDGIESKVEALGSALLAWFEPRLANLGLVSIGWQRHMRGAPVYPADPREQCPRAFLRVSRVGHVEGETLNCATAGVTLQLSLWLQLRQTPGEEHQRRLVSGLDVLQSALLKGEWNFPGLEVETLDNLAAEPAEGVVYDEIEHPLGDPQLRVSSGETSLLLTGRLRG